MNKKVKILMLSLAVFWAGDLAAQSREDGKIKVEITKEINGEKKTFKGEYNSTEEMRADPNYQEFAGDQNEFNFWFDKSGDHDVMVQLDQLRDQNKTFFKFFQDDADGDNTFFFKHFDGDSIDGFFDIQLDGMDMEKYREKMKELGIEMEHLFDKLHDDDGKHVRVIEIKRIKVEEVNDEFGKKGKVDEGSRLILEDLSFYPNPSSNGRFKVRFDVPKEDKLTIKVTNLEGKEVFNRYFESFSGTYSETIDLSGQREGIYLMEISQGKKRLTKKIVIN